MDITFNGALHYGIASAYFVKQLVKELPSVGPVTQVLKQFLGHYNLSDPYTGGLPAYGMTLIVAAIALQLRQQHRQQRQQHRHLQQKQRQRAESTGSMEGGKGGEGGEGGKGGKGGKGGEGGEGRKGMGDTQKETKKGEKDMVHTESLLARKYFMLEQEQKQLEQQQQQLEQQQLEQQQLEQQQLKHHLEHFPPLINAAAAHATTPEKIHNGESKDNTDLPVSSPSSSPELEPTVQQDQKELNSSTAPLLPPAATTTSCAPPPKSPLLGPMMSTDDIPSLNGMIPNGVYNHGGMETVSVKSTPPSPDVPRRKRLSVKGKVPFWNPASQIELGTQRGMEIGRPGKQSNNKAEGPNAEDEEALTAVSTTDQALGCLLMDVMHFVSNAFDFERHTLSVMNGGCAYPRQGLTDPMVIEGKGLLK
jgi:type II secretory pathway pseudopilin PulG